MRIEASVAAEGCLAAPDARMARLLDDLRGASTALVVAPDAVLARVTAGRGLGPIVGIGRIPVERPLEAALDAAPLHPPVLLAAFGVADPGNTGALVRTAHASGAAAFLAVHPTDPYHPRAIRTSMGSVFRVPVVSARTPDEALSLVSRAGIRTCAAVSAGGVSPQDAELGPGPWCVLIGSEAEGLPRALLDRVDRRLSVPMVPGVDSLSANAAAAVLLYAVAQRRPACASAEVLLG
jgi:tRNA G18 (ribose-2'-O)-methylase SpoU